MKSFAQNAPTFYYVRPGMNLAELSWSPGTATEWTVKYATTTGDPTNEQYGTSITVNEANTTLTGLDPFTTYFVYVGARDGNGDLSWSNAYTFKTLATSFAITDDTPYFENFDNTQVFDWVFLSRQTNPLNSTNDTYASYNNHWVYGSGTYNSNYRSLYISYLNNTVYKQDAYYLGYDYAVKMVTLEGGKNYEVSYDWKNYPCLPNQNFQNPDYMDYFRVMLVPSSIHLDPYVNRKPSDLKCNSLPDGWIALDNGYFLVSSNLNWQNKRVTISIPEGQGGDYQVVFFWYSRSQDGHVTSNTPAAVDNLMINTFYGAAPTALTATHEARSAQLSWTENGSATAWEVMYFTGENNDPYTNDGTIVPANTNTIQLTGLTPETDYYAYVRACYSVDGEMKHTRWSSLCYFTTDISCYPVEDLEASNLTQTEATVSWEPGDEEEAWIVRFRNASGIPTTNGFDNGQLPQGWTGLRYDEDEETFVVDNNVWSFDGDNPINGTYSLTTSEEAYLMIPIQSATTQATFFMKGVDDGEVYTKVQAGVYTGDINVFDSDALNYYMENGSVPTTSTQYSVDLSEVPSNYYFYIYVAPTSGGGGPKNRSFKATIDDIVIYATDEWGEETVSITTRTFTNLEAATSYEVQVIAHCDEGDDSQWRSIVFTTPLCPPEDQCNITYSVGVSNTQYGVQWYGDVIQVVHANTNVVVGEITLVEDGPTSGELGLCNGEDYNLVWVDNSGGFPYASFTIIGPDGLVIATASNSPEVGVVASFTMDCDACMVPANLTVANLTTASATLTWEPGGEETEWLVSYRNSYGAEILNESNWTSVPDGWTAMAIGDENDLVVVEDWTLNAGSLVSNMMSFLFIPVPMGGNATITVQGDDEEAVLVGVYQGSLDEVNLQSLGSGILEQVALIGSIQTISVDLSEYEGNGYIFLFHGADGVPANLYLEHLVVYGTGDWPESIPVTGTPSFTIENLVVGTDYQVRVQAVCDDNDYSNPVLISFTTPFCDLEQQCPITYILSDGFGDGWKGYDGDPNSAINVVDAIDGSVHATLTFDDGYSYEGTLPLCPGNYDFVWVSGSYDTECSFTIYGPDGEAILSHEEGYAFPDDGLLGSYTHACPTIFTFIVEGNWDTPSNWDQNDLPQAFNNVVINAAAVIPADCVAEANYITIGTEGSLTIEDGGQLKHKNPGVVATVEKTIGGYTIANGNGDYGVTDGWYLIASPLANNVQPGNVTDMITAQQQDYDLFRYNKDAEGDFVWENYKQGHFTTLEPMQGYLYANHYGTTLKFTGEINPVDDDSYITIPDEPGFYLIGNPLVCDGYPQYYDSWGNCWYNLPYYRMNENQKELIAEVVKGAVLPGEGIFVEQVGKPLSLDVKFFTEYGYDPKKGAIALNLTKDRGAAIDRAIVRFGEGPVLSKLMLNPDNTKVSIPQGGEEYAIVRSASEGEMPVNFKAATNGSYTLNASVNDTEMEYLHLIDNLTGADIDMLETPAYTFNAKTTDYASRFKLVFKAKEDGASTSSGTFAFFNGSTWMVNNTGNAVLQVVDMMGRVLTSEQINGNAKTSIEAAPGVYMMRLVNGNDVKVQKIIIK